MRSRNCKLGKMHVSSISHLRPVPLPPQGTGAHVQPTIPFTDLLYKAQSGRGKNTDGRREGGKEEARKGGREEGREGGRKGEIRG